jgi:hypothetical protein
MAISLDESKKAELVKKHQIPENTTSLNTPKVNPEIWRVLSAETRSKDINLQKIQSNCLKASVPVLRAIDVLVKSQQNAEQVNIEEVVTLLVDNLAIYLYSQ